MASFDNSCFVIRNYTFVISLSLNNFRGSYLKNRMLFQVQIIVTSYVKFYGLSAEMLNCVQINEYMTFFVPSSEQ